MAKTDESAESHQDHVNDLASALRRLKFLYKRERQDILVILVYALLVGLLSLVVPIAANSLVSTIAFGSLLQPIVVLAALVLGALSMSAVMRLMQIYVVEVIKRRIFVRVATSLAVSIPESRREVFGRIHGPELLNRFLEVVTIQKVTAMFLLEGIAVLFQVAIGLTLLAFYHPILLAFDLIILLGIVVVFMLGWGGVATAVGVSERKYATLAWLQELAKHPVLYKSPWGAELALNNADSLAAEYVMARKRHFRIILRQHFASLFFQAVGSALLLAIGGYLVLQQQLTLGQLVAAELVVASILSAVSKFGKHLEALYDWSAAVGKLDILFTLPKETPSGDVGEPRHGPMSVSLTNVAYGFGDSNHVMKNLSLKINPGQNVSIFGRNGSGKSSVANILYKLKLPDEGVVEIDGRDIRDISSTDLRRQVALVRGVEIIPGTIEENIRMGRVSISLADIRQSLEQVGLWDGIAKLPGGLETALTTSGAPLSRGQSLQLMVARAIVSKPRLLMLDETLDGVDTSALDILYETLLAPEAPWTLIDITHETQIWEHFENLFVLEDGALRLVAKQSSPVGEGVV